ncbi:MAG: amino acid ABC transporter ATP-binding protein [Actinobacteria bacterium]|jgi:polar amino acid transport system ATP-binding protein|nr:amino acid ABC transporter ATP-binding protein [Actinomycetota bacterium]NCW83771.1 amino acid ABC transporter ATP-binding protein [Acidimicrobiia bacterium]NDC99878.1 amino acid ABC transporter ATP-binding protein [bacterium]NBQ45493.1 amino acid ABC transporter ATP-binding protein [Actinomycetota bacterium]NBY61163.1 amino acid ABC transporter ATP-binding protein [Actinomycetota bacterium]
MKLELREVRKSFGSRAVLAGLDLKVSAGEVVSFIGSSGSGKTTLLRCINLLEPIDDGTILLDGDEISKIGLDPNPIRRRIGIVFQSFNLFPHMSVQRNITLALTQVLGKQDDEANEIAKSLLTRFALADKIDSYPDQLSGGQQQRVAIVRALAMSPEVMLLDEITSALDPELVGEVLDVVRELKGSGITMLIATHEMKFAQEISDRVCFLDGGRIAEQGQPQQLFTNPSDERTRQFLRRVNF